MNLFISYCHEEAAIMSDIVRVLDAHDIWIDDRLNIGQEWWQKIESAVAACDCFVLILSACYMQSEYCQKELETALRLNKPVAPVMIQEMDYPKQLQRFQVIKWAGTQSTIKLMNGIFEIERQVYNPLRPTNKLLTTATMKLSIKDLYFATTNTRKKRMYEQILNMSLQTTPIEIADIQHIDPGEVALNKAVKAFDAIQKPVFIEQSALSVRAWGGYPGGLTTTTFTTVGLTNICRMLQPFEDKSAESVSVIAFTDGQMKRKFIGVVEGEIAPKPRGDGYSWNNIFIPNGFSKTLGEMSEDENLSLSSRRPAILKFMQFLQANSVDRNLRKGGRERVNKG